MIKNENLALISAILLIIALLTAVVVLLVAHVITLDQVGPFLIALVVPITAIAGLPIFKAVLNAPSPEQTQQLHGTLNQSIQALAQVAQPVASVEPVIEPPKAASTSETKVG
jgi:hypothetical protein